MLTPRHRHPFASPRVQGAGTNLGSSAHAKTGEHDVQGELRDKDVCTFNDWNLIKIYYVQVSAILAQFCAILAQLF